MNQRQFALSGGVGQQQAQLRHIGSQSLAQKLVFAHGEAMACRQGLDMGGGEK